MERIKDKKRTVAVCFRESVIKKLKAEAKKKDISFSSLINQLVAKEYKI